MSEDVVKISMKVKPWTVPNYVHLDVPPEFACAPFSPNPELAIELKNADAQMLARLCDQFRAEVFKKAGKRDPAKE